ncbi:MAG: N-acetyltransferase [Pseudomonadota bacterium]
MYPLRTFSQRPRNLVIKETDRSDLADIHRIEELAFGQPDEAQLVDLMLTDPSAQPLLSLIAIGEGGAVGHILFSAARIPDAEGETKISILAPLAVLPDFQRSGIGGRLIEEGLRHLTDAGVDLVFVLGDPAYYTRHGFEPATRLGLAPPHTLPEAYADAWMVQALRSGLLGRVKGRIVCSDVLNRPEYWVE